MVSAKRAVREIVKLTKDIIWAVPVEEEIIVESLDEIPATATSEVSEVKDSVKTETVENEVYSEKSETVEIIESEELNVERVNKLSEIEDLKESFAKVIGTKKLDEILESEEFKVLDVKEAKEKLSKMLEVEIEAAALSIGSENLELSEESEITVDKADILHEGESKTEEVEIQEELEEPESSIPVIKPPISFPKLPEDVEIPAGDKEKSNLILDIYESIFLAMSIGASKIMGVSPARGLIKRFLPLEDCKTLLDNVDVKNNSVVDFNKIRENAENIPLNERESTLITDFSKIISIITENYGKVMGYGAFRGIVRNEFKTINDSYGKAMNDLGIKDKIHPELTGLFK